MEFFKFRMFSVNLSPSLSFSLLQNPPSTFTGQYIIMQTIENLFYTSLHKQQHFNLRQILYKNIGLHYSGTENTEYFITTILAVAGYMKVISVEASPL